MVSNAAIVSRKRVTKYLHGMFGCLYAGKADAGARIGHSILSNRIIRIIGVRYLSLKFCGALTRFYTNLGLNKDSVKSIEAIGSALRN